MQAPLPNTGQLVEPSSQSPVAVDEVKNRSTGALDGQQSGITINRIAVAEPPPPRGVEPLGPVAQAVQAQLKAEEFERYDSVVDSATVGTANSTATIVSPPTTLEVVERDSADQEDVFDKDLISLEFAADCWLEIRDAMGNKLTVRLFQAGQSYETRGQAPFDIKFGNPTDVSMRFTGQLVAGNPIPGRKILRMRVGP